MSFVLVALGTPILVFWVGTLSPTHALLDLLIISLLCTVCIVSVIVCSILGCVCCGAVHQKEKEKKKTPFDRNRTCDLSVNSRVL